LTEDMWGLDPQVKHLRRVFACVEAAQKDLLETAGISPFDERLRRLRDVALTLFEKVWPVAARKGLVKNEGDAAVLYVFCLARAFSSRGIILPAGSLPDNENVARFLEEALR
jgi:hypothetical protein